VDRLAITRALLEEIETFWDRDSLSPSQINNGYCSFFASRVCRRMGLSIPGHVVWFSQVDPRFFAAFRREGTLTDHAVLEIDGLYYDAECPNGVNSLEDLPVWKWRADRVRYPSMAGRLLPDLASR
jgi:hypothetical protein